jgi:hypothetical protein
MNPERAQLIRDFANDEWVDRITDDYMGDEEFEKLSDEWDQKLNLFLESCVSGEELHYLADYWNWDKGEDVLRVVAGHQYCEKATALLIYWRSSPGYFVDKDVNDIPECNRELYELYSYIKSRYLNNEYISGECSYDPWQEIEDISHEQKRGLIPEIMFKPV